MNDYGVSKSSKYICKGQSIIKLKYKIKNLSGAAARTGNFKEK